MTFDEIMKFMEGHGLEQKNRKVSKSGELEGSYFKDKFGLFTE